MPDHHPRIGSAAGLRPSRACAWRSLSQVIEPLYDSDAINV